MQQRVLLVRISRQAVFTAAGGIDKLKFDARTDARQIAIEPTLERIRRGRTSAFVRLALVRATRRVGFDLVGLAPHDIDTAAIRFPPGDPGSVVFVRIGNALVILFSKFILVSIRIRIAPSPEFLYEPFALFISLQFLEGPSFIIGNDVGDVFFQPVFIGLLQLGLHLASFFRRILTRIAVFVFLGQARWDRKKCGQESDGQPARSSLKHFGITPRA